MNPACALCRGACCETVMLPIEGEVPVTLLLRGHQEADGFRLTSPCRHLSRKGLCRIHDDKPLLCREYEVGGEGCRAAVLSQRPMIADRIFSVLDACHDT